MLDEHTSAAIPLENTEPSPVSALARYLASPTNFALLTESASVETENAQLRIEES